MTAARENNNRYRLIMLAVVVGLTLVRVWYAREIPLAQDEAHTWQWSRHLAWGYFDQAPMIAWLIKLGTALFGSTELGVRSTALLITPLTSLLFYEFCRRIFKDELVGLWVVLLINGTIFFNLAAVINTYDTALALFWLAGMYCAAVAVFEEKPGWWYLSGLACGLAMLTKYSAVLLPALLFAFLLTGKTRRRWAGRKEPWLAAALAALVYSPNLIWNATHNWAAFGHTASLGGGEYLFTTHEFLAGQMGLLGPIAAGLVAIGLVRAVGQARRGDQRQALLLWCALPVLIMFTLMSFKGRVYGNWTAPGYLGAVLAAAFALRQPIMTKPAWRRWGVAALVTGYAIVAMVYFHAPLLRAMSPPANLDPTMEISGWPELGRRIGIQLAEWPKRWPNEDRPFIFGLRYQKPSLAAFYTPGQPETICLFLPGERLNSYAYWADPRKLKGKNALAVVIKGDAWLEARLKTLFDRLELLDVVDLVGASGRVINKVALYRCVNFQGRDARPAWLLPPVSMLEAKKR